MTDFFKGWRRKAGVVTLVLACVLAMGWVRSEGVVDFVDMPLGKCVVAAASVEGMLIVQVTWKFTDGSQFSFSNLWWVTRPVDGGRFFDDDPPPKTFFQWAGFDYDDRCVYHDSPYRLIQFLFPYWSVAAPLALLSANLLLVTPRKTITRTSTLTATHPGESQPA